MSEILDNYFASTARKETLSKQQEQILARVLEIIEKNPALNQALANEFQKNMQETFKNAEKFNLISQLIDENTQKDLSVIEDTYEKERNKDKALEDSKNVISKATVMKLT